MSGADRLLEIEEEAASLAELWTRFWRISVPSLICLLVHGINLYYSPKSTMTQGTVAI